MRQDYDEAVKWFRKSAEQGCPDAQLEVGTAYDSGCGMQQDHVEAIRWWSKAAQQGNANAQCLLGFAYYNGQAVKKDYAEAVKWFAASAAQGQSGAQFGLALAYLLGRGVPQNDLEAYKHASLAAAQGFQSAVELRDKLSKSIAVTQPPMKPATFTDFIGQNRVKARLELAIAAAKLRGEALDHVLLIGSPGSGKTTLAFILARAMGANLKTTNGPTIEKAGDLCGLLTTLEEGDVLFIDDIHRLRRPIEEYLYPALREFKLDCIIDQGANARSVRLNLPCFTLIGSTPNKERLSHELLSCFRIVETMEDYSVDELAAIACRAAGSIQVEIGVDAAGTIARTADGTPAEVLRRFRHVRDFAHVKGNRPAEPSYVEG